MQQVLSYISFYKLCKLHYIMTRFFTNPFHVVSTELLTSSLVLLLIHSIHIHGHIRDHSHSHGRTHHSHSIQHQQTSCRSIHGHTHVRTPRSHIRGHILRSRSIQLQHQRTSCHSSRIHDRSIRSQAQQQPWAQPQPQQWLQPPSCRSNRGGHIRRSRNRVRILRIHHSSHSQARQQL